VTRSGLVLLLAATCFSFGCATKPTLYQWGAYEQTLHQAYKNPGAIPAFQAELLNVIQTNERAGLSPPPGLYAEYGYALYLNNQIDSAIIYFAKERDMWPESVVLMTTVIKRLETRKEEEENRPAEENDPDASESE
jgi:hypothetical protein